VWVENCFSTGGIFLTKLSNYNRKASEKQKGV